MRRLLFLFLLFAAPTSAQSVTLAALDRSASTKSLTWGATLPQDKALRSDVHVVSFGSALQRVPHGNRARVSHALDENPSLADLFHAPQPARFILQFDTAPQYSRLLSIMQQATRTGDAQEPVKVPGPLPVVLVLAAVCSLRLVAGSKTALSNHRGPSAYRRFADRSSVIRQAPG